MGALWLTGCWWLMLDLFVAQHGPFGAIPNPLEPTLLLLHGICSIAAMYLLGWITARHVLRWWTSGMRRLSGATLAAVFAVLAVSGFALFFITKDAWQHAAAVVHEVLGVSVTIFAVQHWFFRGRRSPVG
jgi:uncharacterized membrane protein